MKDTELAEVEESQAKKALTKFPEYLKTTLSSSKTSKWIKRMGKEVQAAYPKEYAFQYAGFKKDAREFILFNVGSKEMLDEKDPHRPIIAMDGGASFWRAIYDIEKGEFVHFETNGEA